MSEALDVLDGLPLTHHEVVNEGVALHYVAAGEGPLVVLVHGFPDSWYTWHHQIPALVRAGFRVVAPTLRGYAPSGLARGLPEYGIKHLASDVAAVIRACGVERAHVVGHDWGAAAAWGFAMSYPELLDRLVIENLLHPVVFARALKSPLTHLRAPHFALFQLPGLPELALAANDHALLRWLWKAGCAVPGAFDAEAQRRALGALGRPERLEAALGFYRAAARFPEEGVEPRPIDRPVLMIMGEQDPVIDASQAGASARWLPDVKVTRIPEAAHWCHLESPQKVNDALLGFLNGRV